MLVTEQADQLQQRQGEVRSPADVVGASADLIDPADRRVVDPQQVVDEQNVPYLFAVAVNHDWLPLQGANREPGDPALILQSELVRPVDAGLPEYHGIEPEDAGVIDDVLIAAPLRAAVGGIEVERDRFGHSVRQRRIGIAGTEVRDGDGGELAIDLVGRAVQHDGPAGGAAHRLQHVEGSERVDREISGGIADRSGDRDLRCEME